MTPSNVQILAYEDTPLGPLCLRRRELLSAPGVVVTEVTLNHAFLMSSYNTESERALARIALEMNGGTDLGVLVGGLGLGYTARAALASARVARVEVVEFLPQVIGWLEQELAPLSSALKADPRFTTVVGDIYARLTAAPVEAFDLILIDVDHAPDDQLSRANDFFYTEAGLKLASRHLAADGILGVWSYAESSTFSGALRQVFRDVRVERVTFFNQLIDEETTDWLFFARDPVPPARRGGAGGGAERGQRFAPRSPRHPRQAGGARHGARSLTPGHVEIPSALLQGLRTGRHG